MKRMAVAVVLALVSVVAAETSLGVDLYFKAHDDGYEDIDFQVLPTLILRPSYNVEIAPRAGFNVDMNGTDFTLLAGCGAYFRVIDGNVFALSLGPDIGVPIGFADDLMRTGFGIGMPLNLDFLVHRAVFLRMGMRVVGFDLNVDVRDNAPNETSFDFVINTVQRPFVGVYFTF